MVGLLWAAAALLAIAGLGKLFRPGPAARAVSAAELPAGSLLATRPVIRLFGAGELVIAGWVIAGGGALPAVLLAGCYLVLTIVAWRMVQLAPGQDCGCFGAESEPVSWLHVVVNLVGMGIGLAAAGWPQPPIAELLTVEGWSGVLVIVLAGVLAALGYLLMTAAPALHAIRTKVAAR